MALILDIKPGGSIRLTWSASDAVDVVSEGDMLAVHGVQFGRRLGRAENRYPAAIGSTISIGDDVSIDIRTSRRGPAYLALRVSAPRSIGIEDNDRTAREAS